MSQYFDDRFYSILIFIAAIKELGLQDTDKQPTVPLTEKQVQAAAERVVNKFVALKLPDLTATDTIRYLQ